MVVQVGHAHEDATAFRVGDVDLRIRQDKAAGAFDQETALELQPTRVHDPVPPRVLEVLAHSEIFKQAYYVADRSWVAEEDQRFRPGNTLALEDEVAVAAWPPVYNTLKQFAEGYDRFVERLVSRR